MLSFFAIFVCSALMNDEVKIIRTDTHAKRYPIIKFSHHTAWNDGVKIGSCELIPVNRGEREI